MNFSHNEVLWILHNYQTLQSGQMPQKEESVRHVFSYHAPFEHPCQLAAEISIRVKRCGLDGLLVEARFGMFGGGYETDWQLAQRRHLPIDDIHSRINRVTWYITGPDIKQESYDDWKRENRFRQILRVPSMLVTAS